MPAAKTDVPLFVQLELTPEQQRRIRERTGRVVTSLPIETRAASVRCRFGGLELAVPRGVFMPTSSSQRTFEFALAVGDTQKAGSIIIDVGTGTGAIALALAHRLPAAIVYGTEISPLALRAARRNRTRLGLRNVHFASGSLLSPLPRRLTGRVDLIIANVPYLPPSRRKEASGAFPDGTAFGTDSDGLGLVRRVLRSARTFLRPGGSLVVQVGDVQWSALASEAEKLGYVKPLLALPDESGPVAGRLSWNSQPIHSARQE